MGVVLVIIAALAFTTNQSRGGLIGIATLMVFLQLIYNISVGPLCKRSCRPPLYIALIHLIGYSISGELPNSRLRAQSIVLGRATYLIAQLVITQISTRMVSKAAWNIGAKSALFWLGTNVACSIWTFFRLPETGGRSFAELSILFANKISARKFKETVVHGEHLLSRSPAKFR